MKQMNVVALDSALKLTRASTVRSSAYQTKAARLASLQQQRLIILEEKLFGSRGGLEACQAGQLQKLEGQFICADGKIWYYFSKPKRKFVLLDFAFGGDGSGGLPVPNGNGSGLVVSLRRCGGQFGPSRWVAWLAAAGVMSASVAKLTTTRHVSRATDALRHALSRIVPRQRPRHDVIVGLKGRLCEIDDQRRILAVLPEWSILAAFVTAPEQLENRYARSILAGEALCHVAKQSAFVKRLLWRAKSGPHLADDLLQESTTALNVMFAGEKISPSNLRRFKITEALGENPLADDCILSIFRSELTAYLSVFVASSVTTALPYYSVRRSSTEHVMALRVMKKYALLADFAGLFEQLCKPVRLDVDADVLWKDWESDMKSRLAMKALRDIGTFDLSVRVLLTDFRVGADRVAGDNAELPKLHHQLLSVMKELLAPLE